MANYRRKERLTYTPEDHAEIGRTLKMEAEWRNTGIHDELQGWGDAHEDVQFGIDGEEYAIHLNHTHSDELRDLLSPYIKVARLVLDVDGKPPTQGPPVQ